MRFARHYTLLELLVVMATLSILLGFALPSVVGQRAAGRLDEQVQTTLALTRKARAWATSEGRTVRLLVEEDGLRLVRSRDPLAEAEGDEPEIEPAREGAPVWEQAYVNGVSLIEFEVAGELGEMGEHAALGFFPSGAATAAAFTFQAGDLQARLELDATLGIARVVEVEE